MGFFKFLTGETVDDKKITTYLHLMWLVMCQDGEQSESENIYLRNYISSLNLNNFHTKRIMGKMESIKMDDALEIAKKLSEKEKHDLMDKLMEIAKIDGKLDGKEAFMIVGIAGILDLDGEKIIGHMMNEYELDENELKEAINEFNEKRNPSQKDSVKKPSKKSSKDKVFCSKCGSDQTGNSFCTQCGTKVS